jgi:hypothetical protein
VKRLTYTSMLLEAIELEEGGAPKGFPEQSTRGDEDQCARCGLDTGSVPDSEGRLLCVECGDKLGLIPYE